MDDETLKRAGFTDAELPIARLFFQLYTLTESGQWVLIAEAKRE